MQQRVIACRLGSYDPFEAGAYAHMASLGIRHVEISVPPPDKIDSTCAELAQHGLIASSLHGECDVQKPGTGDQVAAQMPAFKALGTRLMFVSVRADNTPLDTVYARLHEAGDAAATHGVTIILETHPDLVTNARVARATMTGVNHPNVRINFDTANVYYYNHDVDAVAELRSIIDFVAALHLKDTNGGYKTWNFPAIGRGVVDFNGVFGVLDDAAFAGPCTLEVEGIEGETKTESLVRQRVADSVAYLHQLGRF